MTQPYLILIFVSGKVAAIVELTPIWQDPSDAAHMLFELSVIAYN